jgi:hypothetical protein
MRGGHEEKRGLMEPLFHWWGRGTFVLNQELDQILGIEKILEVKVTE